MDNPGPSTSNYKYCLVPRCTSTSIKTPGKVFVALPSSKQMKRRKLWLKAMRRNEKDISQHTTGFVCEDHFNFEEDMVNHLKWKLMGGNIFLKENVVPHIFLCQKDRKRSFPTRGRESTIKRVRHAAITDLLEEAGQEVKNTGLEDHQENIPEYNQELQDIPILALEDQSSSSLKDKSETEAKSTAVKEDQENIVQYNRELQEIPILAFDQSSLNDKYSQTDVINYKTIAIQTKRQNFRSKGIQTNFSENIRKVTTIACSPIKMPKSPTKRNVCAKDILNTSSSSISSISDTTEIVCSSEQSQSSASYLSDSGKIDRIKTISIERSNYFNVKKCRLYLGVPNDCYFVVTVLLKTIKCELRDIYITLKKIRTNLPFEYLGDDFGVSAGQAAKIFKKTVPAVSCCVKNYIFWPEKNKIKQMLPLAFRANYNNVQSIIDCFEIEIDKPNNPVQQAGTWSEYKKSNTLKYLISVTPDGFVNFISNGYGGRTTDVAIVQKSEYLKVLPRNCSVMADRGFKRVDTLLQPLNCILIRPPSVKVGTKSTKLEVLETKRIAALRIHVERVIRRIREFKILKLHACVNNKLIKYLDHIVIIACGLINVQSNIIKVE